jgi:hypothetical protein
VTIRVPETIYAGDTVIFDVPAFSDSVGNSIDSGSYSLIWYARTNATSVGASITGVAESDGWRITVPSSTSTDFDTGLWTWQAVATSGALSHTAGRGQFAVKATLVYSGIPGAFDDRSRAQIDYDYVNAAIRTLSQGGAVQEYTIGGRSLKRYKMTELLELRDSLKAEVDRERRAEKIKQGLGNPGVTRVRFI